MAKAKFKVEGMEELAKSFGELGKVPQKHVTSASKKAMNPVLKNAKANAPYDTGALKKGLKLVGEKSKAKAKKVYRIVFDRSMNKVFQKPNKEGKITGYYPVSQEYGFFARDGKYIPGFRFIHDSFASNAKNIERTTIDEMKKKIDAEIAKARLR